MGFEGFGFDLDLGLGFKMGLDWKAAAEFLLIPDFGKRWRRGGG